MTLPTSRELRELLNKAAPGPWEVQQLNQQCVDYATTEFWISSEEPRYIATMEVLSEDYDQTQKDFTLISLAPQLAEEVIRLRKEIDRLKWHCRDSEQVADAETRLADTEREKAWQEGRAEAYYDTYLQITQGQRKEDKEGGQQMTPSYGPWHRWFAWRPVKTRQHGWRWLCTVERALHYPDPLIPFAPDPYWVYRPTPTDRKDINE